MDEADCVLSANGEQLREALIASIDKLEADMIERKVFYRDAQEFIARRRYKHWKRKAEDCLSIIAEDPTAPIRGEALVYLRCQGHECLDEVELFRNTMQHCEERSLAEMPASEDQEPCFWSSSNEHDATCRAALLRTAEWCAIRGFDHWWERIGGDLAAGDAQPVEASYALFLLVRSNWAIERFRVPMEHQVATLLRNSPPWKRPEENQFDIKVAASLLFTFCRIHSSSCADFQAAGSSFLLRYQNPDGSWNAIAKEGSASLEVTAIAMHALALARPETYKQSLMRARDWLLLQQREGGTWVEDAVSFVYLTVLVLDAIELAEDSRRVTFMKAPSNDVISSNQLTSFSGTDEGGSRGVESAQIPEFAHASDFTWVNWCGVRYEFTQGNRARTIRALWEEWEQSGRMDGSGLSEESIRQRIGSSSSRFRVATTLRGHPALGTMIRPVGRGRFALFRTTRIATESP